MAGALSGVRDRSVAAVASRLAEAGVLGARGNSGMMLSHFFLGFAEGLDGQSRAGPSELAAAMRLASDSLYQAVDQPVEGTILTVVRESTQEIHQSLPHAADLKLMAHRLLRAARASLERTPDLLPVLREANVVDAGAKGFVRFVEGMVALIDGVSRRPATGLILDMPDAAAATEYPREADRGFRYCAEFLVRGDPLPKRQSLAGTVRGLGSSLIVTRASAVAKIHIHTDVPERVERALGGLGVAVERVKAEDMRAQHRKRRRVARRRLALVTDSTCDLPPELIIERDVTVVPLNVMFGDEAFLDQVEIDHEEFLRRLTDPEQPQPTTSQPTPAHLDDAFRQAAARADEVVGLFVSGAVSGTLAQAEAAAARFQDAKIHIFNSRTSSLGLGFQVLRAAELASEGCGAEELIAELERLQSRSGVYLTVDTLTYLQRSGRVGKARAFLANLLHLKPVLGVDETGSLIPVDRVHGREALIPRVLELLRDEVPAERRRLRMGVAHIHAPDVAERLTAALREEFRPDEVLVRPAAGVIAAHTGPGAWGVFYQAE